MSILNHPDYESTIKPWCEAVAAGREPPEIEFDGNSAGKSWFLDLNPAWHRSVSYRLKPRTIKIGDREVNAPVDHETDYFFYLLGARFNFANKGDQFSLLNALQDVLKDKP